VTPPLFLFDELPAVDPGDELRLTGDEGRHAAKVRRVGVGEAVLVSDGQGTLLDCTVTAVLADGLTLAVHAERAVPRPQPRLVVVQALPKGERAELAVELLTELGVDEIVPWAAARAVVQWHGPRGDKALAKWRRTAREAAKQSRRAWVPEVSPLATTEEVSKRCTAACGLVLHEDATTPLADIDITPADEVVVVVGPEGGIAPAELDGFVSAGAAPVRLGAEVLRTSTAGAAAAAVLSVRLARWS
jgi:16S rRNA (uracil1498-N3)-methyltransferase